MSDYVPAYSAVSALALTRSNCSVTSVESGDVSNVAMMATGIAATKPSAAAIAPSNIPLGPAELNSRMPTTVTVPATMEAGAPRKLDQRQWRARTVAGPKAAPIPPHA